MTVASLTAVQSALLAEWLPGAHLVHDHSWGLVGTTVLQLQWRGEPYIAKAGDACGHHIARELRAHREWLGPWVRSGRAPHLVHADADAKLLVTVYLPGQLVQGHPAEYTPDTYRQAGRLLAQLHGQAAVEDNSFEARQQRKVLACLDLPHAIPATVEERIRRIVAAWPTPSSRCVPTHGDWQPRNWLVDNGVIKVIDLGRADLRPASTDLLRLAAQQFSVRPELERAFLDGYGDDPREPAAWQRQLLAEAVGTAIWAHQVGDELFEQQGHRMIQQALGAATPRGEGSSCGRSVLFRRSLIR